VEAEGRLQPGDGHLVQAQDAHQGVALYAVQEIGAAENQAGLRAAEELVAAEGDHVRARRHASLDRRLRDQSIARQVDQRAAAETARKTAAALLLTARAASAPVSSRSSGARCARRLPRSPLSTSTSSSAWLRAVSAIASAAARERTARPRPVWSTTPVALIA